MSVDICYIIAQGFSLRMILHSQIVPHLRAHGKTIGVVTPNAHEENIKVLAAEYGIALFPARGDQQTQTTFYDKVRPYLTEDLRQNYALRAKHHLFKHARQKRAKNLLVYYAVWVLNFLLFRIPLLASLPRRLERRRLHCPKIQTQLAEMRPGLLVATYPVNPLEARYLHAAQGLGIETVGQLLSWDNITSKGRFAAVPHRFLAWGPIMHEELRQHYNVSPECVVETGVAHFDMYTHTTRDDLFREILTEIGLSVQKPYILFGMSSPLFCPREIDVVEWLADQINAGVFGSDMQLVVRPHPQNIQGNMMDESWLPRLKAIAGARVGIQYPLLEKSKLAWNMNRDDLPRLSRLFHGCCLSINSGSTFSIDAMLHGKPVIMTMFDANDQLPWWRSVSRFINYTHLSKLISFGGVRVTRSFGELGQAVATYLKDPQTDEAQRKETCANQVGPVDGGASVRVAEALCLYLSKTNSGEKP